MFTIVGTKISLTQGDNGAFRITVRDLSDNLIELTDRDRLYLSVRRRLTTDILLLKASMVKKVEDVFEHTFEFERSDTIDLDSGVYTYDVILELADQRRYTVVPESVFVIEPSVGLTNVPTDELTATILDQRSKMVISAPLVATIDYVSFSRTYQLPEDYSVITF
jgi:hypothetical protein